MNSAILVYTISDDRLREDFVDALIARGWYNHKDQSTLTFPPNPNLLIFNSRSFQEWFKKWSKGKKWSATDFVQVFYPQIITKGEIKIPTLQSMDFHRV